MTAFQIGAKGKAVKSLQYALGSAGISGRFKATGTFDEATADALKKFQKKAGLRADGIATPAVMVALGRVTERGKAPIRPHPDYTPFLNREAEAFQTLDRKHKNYLTFCYALPGEAYTALINEARENRKAHRMAYLSWKDRAMTIVKAQKELARCEKTDPSEAQRLNRTITHTADQARKDWHEKRRFVVKFQELMDRYEELRMARV
ncbi:MAG: peptidoglycan-binding domain-containing protein [Pseudomonadota bacterium]